MIFLKRLFHGGFTAFTFFGLEKKTGRKSKETDNGKKSEDTETQRSREKHKSKETNKQKHRTTIIPKKSPKRQNHRNIALQNEMVFAYAVAANGFEIHRLHQPDIHVQVKPSRTRRQSHMGAFDGFAFRARRTPAKSKSDILASMTIRLYPELQGTPKNDPVTTPRLNLAFVKLPNFDEIATYRY